MRPAVLLADEPTGNLDSRSGGVVLDLVDRLNEGGLTVLVVTHDPRVAHRADRVLFLDDGRIVQRVARQELAAALASRELDAERP
jgi:putative ABC transport system ATP-binding protein